MKHHENRFFIQQWVSKLKWTGSKSPAAAHQPYAPYVMTSFGQKKMKAVCLFALILMNSALESSKHRVVYELIISLYWFSDCTNNSSCNTINLHVFLFIDFSFHNSTLLNVFDFHSINFSVNCAADEVCMGVELNGIYFVRWKNHSRPEKLLTHVELSQLVMMAVIGWVIS